MAIAKRVKTAARKTEKAVVEPVVKGAKKLLKPVAHSLKTTSRRSTSRSRKSSGSKSKR